VPSDHAGKITCGDLPPQNCALFMRLQIHAFNHRVAASAPSYSRQKQSRSRPPMLRVARHYPPTEWLRFSIFWLEKYR